MGFKILSDTAAEEEFAGLSDLQELIPTIISFLTKLENTERYTIEQIAMKYKHNGTYLASVTVLEWDEVNSEVVDVFTAFESGRSFGGALLKVEDRLARDELALRKSKYRTVVEVNRDIRKAAKGKGDGTQKTMGRRKKPRKQAAMEEVDGIRF